MIVLFALSLLAMLAMVAVAVDGGTLYLQRRTAQNAADAAALAGARALQQATASPTSTIPSEICKYVLANNFGATPTASAYFVDVNGAQVSGGGIALSQRCSGGMSSVALLPTYSGVHVDVTMGPYNTYLAGLIGVRQLQAQASATAHVGLLGIPLADLTPLAGCGPDMLMNGKSPTPNDNILLGDGVATPYSINPAKYNKDFVLQGSQLSKNESSPPCPTSGGRSWKGKIDISGISGTVVPPFSVPTDGGNGTIDSQISAACIATGQADPSGSSAVPPDLCLLLVPIAAPPNPSNSANIVVFGCFSVYAPGPGFQKWRGVLHPTSDCPYGVYAPGWKWGNSPSGTRVLLTS